MQTISVEVKDSYMQKFMDFINNSHSNIVVKKDKNLEYDSYFYERQKELHQIRNDIKNGNMEMLSQEQYEEEIEEFFSELEK